MIALALIAGLSLVAGLGVVVGLQFGRGLGCRKGVVLIGQLVKFQSATRFEVSIHGVTHPVAGLDAERRLSLMVTSDGVAVEVDIDDGADLLRELYDGRIWLHELEEAT